MAGVKAIKIQLLENGDQYYPAVFDAIARGTSKKLSLRPLSGLKMTVGKQLHAALARQPPSAESKQRCLLDGYGSPDLSDEFCRMS